MLCSVPDVTCSFGIMMSVLILQHLAVPGFPLIPDPLDSSSYGLKGRFTMVGEAVKRLTSVSPELAHVLSKCCELYADHRCTSVEALGLLPELPRTWSHESTVWKPAPTASPPVFFPYHSDSMESTDPSVSSEEGEGRSLSPVIDSSVRVSDLESTESVVGGSGRPLRVYPSTALVSHAHILRYFF